MTRPDVEARKQQLNAELRDYMAARRQQVEEISRKVASLGSFNAASEQDRVANARHATVAEGVFLEGTNNSDDKAPVNFLELGIRASRSVCHIVDQNGASLGTGFLVAPDILITNNHVLPDAESAQEAIAVFQYELDADEFPLAPRRFRLRPEILFATSPRGALDFTFVSVNKRGLKDENLAEQGWIPMDERPNKILEGQPIIIIQHPNGLMKSLCLFDSVLAFRDKDPAHPYILYTTDTDNGSSGSPAFNRFWQVVGLHHASVEDDKKHDGKTILNRGIRISSIFAALKNGPKPGILEGDEAQIDAIYLRLSNPQTKRNGRPFEPDAAKVAKARVLEEGTKKKKGTTIRRRETAHLDGRRGYDPTFLMPASAKSKTKAKHPLYVPLPKLPDWLKADAAQIIGSASDYVLKYQHFSIVMSASRSLAIYTACNVDGARMYKLDREDRDPDSFLDPDVTPEAAADVWYYDPRISENHQLGPDVYDDTEFEYGHLVRRLDPVWGKDDRTPRIANDDTFFMTNCSPQEMRFHRTRKSEDGNWSAMEDVILNEANLKDRRFCVLTGPVLDTRDRTILGVKIPSAFWKIAAYEENRALKAHGFLLLQKTEVEEMDARYETTIDLSKAKRPVKITEIARMTGLDFGPLFEADVRG
ncbi:endonuclease G [Bradyrhizobium yuanmingense]|uniref:Endonuclease G n=1 Tax=Bradyrhizobium yuanmingense TaxID=108015 RepID=A0ABV4GA30_9BRAD|nr:DNA/RNA non-specific endonuclease [Bradyrhizobium yuanmingense]